MVNPINQKEESKEELINLALNDYVIIFIQ